MMYPEAIPFRTDRSFLRAESVPSSSHEAGPSVPVPFVIFTRERSGSTLLVSLLSAHHRVRCAGEAFSSQSVGGNLSPANWTTTRRNHEPALFLDALFSAPPASQLPPGTLPPLAVGFKAFNHQLPWAEFSRLAFSPEVRKIYLYRPNLIDRYLSSWIANTYNAWLIKDTSNITVPVNTTHMLWWMQYEAEVHKTFQAIQTVAATRPGGAEAWIQVGYEDLSADAALQAGGGGERSAGGDAGETGAMAKIWAHLSLRPPHHHPPQPMKRAPHGGRGDAVDAPPPMTKQQRMRHTQTIQNYDEVRLALAPHPAFAAMLDQPL